MDSAPAGLAVKVAGAALAAPAAPGVAAALAGLLWPAATVAMLVAGTLAIVSQHRANTEAAAEIVARESATRAAVVALQAENKRLDRALASAMKVAAEREKPVRQPAARLAAPVPSRPVLAGIAVDVSTEGALQWEGKPVTLDEFLSRLTGYQAANKESRLVVKAYGARFLQLNWVLEQARLAGVTHLVVESDAPPDGRVINTWF